MPVVIPSPQLSPIHSPGSGLDLNVRGSCTIFLLNRPRSSRIRVSHSQMLWLHFAWC